MLSRSGWYLPLIFWLQDCKCGPGSLSSVAASRTLYSFMFSLLPARTLVLSAEIGKVFMGKTSLIDTGGHSVVVNGPVLPQSLTSRTLNVKCFVQVFLHHLSYKLKQILVVTKPNPQTLTFLQLTLNKSLPLSVAHPHLVAKPFRPPSRIFTLKFSTVADVWRHTWITLFYCIFCITSYPASHTAKYHFCFPPCSQAFCNYQLYTVTFLSSS